MWDMGGVVDLPCSPPAYGITLLLLYTLLEFFVYYLVSFHFDPPITTPLFMS